MVQQYLAEGGHAVMNSVRSGAFTAASRSWRRRVAAPLCVLLLLALAACNGTAVVTLTSTASQDTFLAYRVGLVSIQLQTSNGVTTSQSQALPARTTVDLARLVNVSEVLGAAPAPQGALTRAVVTLDYSSADIVFDDGSVNGIALTPLGAGGQALGTVTLTLVLDPSQPVAISRGGAPRLSLDLKLAASNLVNLAQKTVTVTPLIAASASPIDSKVVRIRGPLAGVNAANSAFTTGVVPFDFSTAEAGQLTITPSAVATYEINGAPATGSAGLTQLSSLSSGVITAAFGTLTSSSASSTNSNSTDVSFAATQVLAGSSVQGSGFDRLSGIVSGRSGNTLTMEDGTLLGNDGTNTFIPGTATINIGANTGVTEFGQGSVPSTGVRQISVGSRIYAFGTAGTPVAGNITLDASAGRVRLGPTSASGLVTTQGSGTLSLDLVSLGGRSTGAFDFVGTGTSPGNDASAARFQVATGSLDLTNSTVGSPVEVTGLVAAFGAAPPNFSASALLDATTINAQLVLDWSAGTTAPFAAFNSSQIEVNVFNNGIGARHEIQIGAQTINVYALASDPLIMPDQTNSNTVFTIGHALSGTFENFVSFTSFITQLQTELNGSSLATGITALGQYTASTNTLSASSITLFLNN
jgi:hypothetical protein